MNNQPFVVLITGMCVVFLGIVVLVGIVKLMSLGCSLFKRKDKNESAPTETKNVPVAPKKVAPEAGAMPPDERRQMIAVISAAIAETMGANISGIRIRSIKKL